MYPHKSGREPGSHSSRYCSLIGSFVPTGHAPIRSKDLASPPPCEIRILSPRLRTFAVYTLSVPGGRRSAVGSSKARPQPSFFFLSLSALGLSPSFRPLLLPSSHPPCSFLLRRPGPHRLPNPKFEIPIPKFLVTASLPHCENPFFSVASVCSVVPFGC